MDVGKEQFLMFVVTIIGVLASRFIGGVALGIVVKFAINLARGVGQQTCSRFTLRFNNKITIRWSSSYWVLPIFNFLR